ncbi:hypothetical protein [Halorientalis halophila]|uniref:hypothetical protein n=1 Tax=Halorientalis halophila TaxID=3108499 RepID=UPI0030088CD5
MIAGAGCLRSAQSEDRSEQLRYPDSERVAWHLPLGGPRNDSLRGVIPAESGPVTFGSNAGDADADTLRPWLLARATDGTGRWTETVPPEGIESGVLTPTDGTVLADGRFGFALSGFSERAGGTFGGLLVADSEGSVTAHEQYRRDVTTNLFAISRLGDGTVVLGGTQRGSGSWFHGVSADGETRWEHGSEADRRLVTGLVPTADGALAVGTDRSGSDTDLGWTATVDADGVAWQATLDTPARSVRRADGNYLVRTEAGWHRVDAAGTVLETDVFGGRPYPMTATTDGRLFVGTTDEDGLLVATTEDGTERWRERIGGERREELTDVVALSDGGALAVGATRSYRSAQEVASATATPDGTEMRSNAWLVRVDL